MYDHLARSGILQIVMFRMMRESLLFFTLLALLAIGFGQSLTGLDNVDTSGNGKFSTFDDSTETIVHSLIQGLLG